MFRRFFPNKNMCKPLGVSKSRNLLSQSSSPTRMRIRARKHHHCLLQSLPVVDRRVPYLPAISEEAEYLVAPTNEKNLQPGSGSYAPHSFGEVSSSYSRSIISQYGLLHKESSARNPREEYDKTMTMDEKFNFNVDALEKELMDLSLSLLENQAAIMDLRVQILNASMAFQAVTAKIVPRKSEIERSGHKTSVPSGNRTHRSKASPLATYLDSFNTFDLECFTRDRCRWSA